MIKRWYSQISRFKFATTTTMANNKTLDPVFRAMSNRPVEMDQFIEDRADIFGPNNPLRFLEEEGRISHDLSIDDLKHFKFEAALEEAEKACKIYEEFFDPSFIALMDAILEKSQVETRLKKFDQALAGIKHVQDLCKKVIIEFKKEIEIYLRFGETYLAAQDYENADYYFKRCLDIGSAHPKKYRDEINDANYGLGGLYLEIEDLDKALDYYYKVLENTTGTIREDQPRYYRALVKVGGILLDQGELVEALRLLESGLEYYNTFGTQDTIEDMLYCYQQYGRLLMARGTYHLAVKILARVVQIETKIIGKKIDECEAFQELKSATRYIGDDTEVKKIKEMLKDYK